MLDRFILRVLWRIFKVESHPKKQRRAPFFLRGNK